MGTNLEIHIQILRQILRDNLETDKQKCPTAPGTKLTAKEKHCARLFSVKIALINFTVGCTHTHILVFAAVTAPRDRHRRVQPQDFRGPENRGSRPARRGG